MKTCSICQCTKSADLFYSHQRTHKGTGKAFTYYFPYCKECNSQKKRDVGHTRKGIAHTLFMSQTLHSKKRGYPLPTYTERELSVWLYAQPAFEPLYSAWEKSDYLSDLKPSCNRLDDYRGYSLCNIELTTWKCNKEAWAQDCLSGKNRKISRPIKQYTLKGVFLQEFFSIQDAARKTNVPHPNIIKVCTGKRQTAGGYVWKYTDPRSATKYTGFTART